MARADSLRMRAGQIFCACDIDGLPLDLDAMPKDASILRMATAFGLTVLSQVLALSVLPLASASLATPQSALPLPYLALLFGSALASFPASFLMDMFGRKSAFALGASLGLAGGILAAWALYTRQYPAFMIGVLWLGMAQGFGLFYRHAAAMAAGAGGIVFGAGVVGALVAPFLISLLASFFGPLTSSATLAASGLVSLVMLGLAVTLPSRRIEIETDERNIKRPSWILVLAATEIAALAWFGMTGIMAHAPLAMAGCGMSMSMSSIAMAAHLSAMYWPGFVIGRLIVKLGTVPTSLIGLAMVGIGGVATLYQSHVIGFTLAMSFAGFGWGMATIGATAALHRAGRPSPSALALHDIALFLAAMLGAAVFGRLA